MLCPPPTPSDLCHSSYLVVATPTPFPACKEGLPSVQLLQMSPQVTINPITQPSPFQWAVLQQSLVREQPPSLPGTWAPFPLFMAP